MRLANNVRDPGMDLQVGNGLLLYVKYNSATNYSNATYITLGLVYDSII